MSTTYVSARFGEAVSPMQCALRLFKRYCGMLREWHECDRLRGALYNLSDRELQDIATTRGEIEYVARSRSVGPRRGRSA